MGTETNGPVGSFSIFIFLHRQRLKRGDRIGFASCEGGLATGTHFHIARKYNGEWMPIDSAISFNLEGWIAHTGDAVYQGTLTRRNQTVTASSYSNAASLIRAGY
jgi:LasA protease